MTLSLLGAYSNFAEWKSDHNILFLSHDFTLSGKHDCEIAEVRFFPLDRLAGGPLARSSPAPGRISGGSRLPPVRGVVSD